MDFPFIKTNGTATQMGGFDYSIANNADGSITIRVNNTISIDSLFYHLTGGYRPPRGLGPINYITDSPIPMMGNMFQHFEWEESKPCGCP